MKKLFILITAVSFSVCASAQTLLDRFVSNLEKTGVQAVISYNDGNGPEEGTMSLSGSRYRFEDSETIIWFDGKTMWRGQDYGADMIEEIYISTPTPQEQFMLNPITALKHHDGFSVTDDGRSTITLKAQGESVEGITLLTVKADEKTLAPKTITVQCDPEFDLPVITITVKEFKTGVKFDKATFTCNVKDYPDADIIDLR